MGHLLLLLSSRLTKNIQTRPPKKNTSQHELSTTPLLCRYVLTAASKVVAHSSTSSCRLECTATLRPTPERLPYRRIQPQLRPISNQRKPTVVALAYCAQQRGERRGVQFRRSQLFNYRGRKRQGRDAIYATASGNS